MGRAAFPRELASLGSPSSDLKATLGAGGSADISDCVWPWLHKKQAATICEIKHFASKIN